MTTDELRRMLELAARACGYQLDADGDRIDVRASGGAPMPWRPGTDDGDSARMRSALLIDADWYAGLVQFSIDCVGERYLIFSQPQDKDELHELIARRRARMVSDGNAARF